LRLAQHQLVAGIARQQRGRNGARLERQAQLRRHRRHGVRALRQQGFDQHFQPGALHHGDGAQAFASSAVAASTQSAGSPSTCSSTSAGSAAFSLTPTAAALSRAAG
jgi:hypothetical protein